MQALLPNAVANDVGNAVAKVIANAVVGGVANAIVNVVVFRESRSMADGRSDHGVFGGGGYQSKYQTSRNGKLSPSFENKLLVYYGGDNISSFLNIDY